MKLVELTEAPQPFEGLLQHRPELRSLYKRFYGAFWDEALLPRSLLELCRLRIAQLHDCEAELAVTDTGSGVPDNQRVGLDRWEAADCFSPLDRAALAIAELMPWQHHSMTDAQFATLREHLDEKQCVALVVALALFDANCRLRLVFELPASPASEPAFSSGLLH